MFTKTEVFGAEYAQKAHLQKGFNPHLIDDLVDYILRVKPEARIKPIRMLDLCCGDGGSTYSLLKKCDERGIQVDSLMGYDISLPQIEVALEYARIEPRLQFAVRDINELAGEQDVDVVVSLFGLHWLKDMNSIAAKIQRCLKPNGILMFFVPLETNDLFLLRTQLIRSTKWHDKFSDFTLEPFISEPRDYFLAISPFFTDENEGGIYCAENIEFDRGRFADFISSWMQEIRHLKNDEDKKAYVNDLIDSFPASSELCSDVKHIISKTGEPKIQIFGRYSWFHAQKKVSTDSDQSLVFKPECPSI